MLLALPAFAAQKSFNPNASPEQFAEWQADTRTLLSGILFNGAPPQGVPFEAKFGRQETREGYTLTEVSFNDRAGHVTSGWMARPLKPAGAKLPLMLICHGHGGNGYQAFDPKSIYYFGERFAQKGYIVFAPNLGHEALEGLPSRISWGPFPKEVKFPFMGQRVWMVERSIDFMLTQPGVDPEKIGIAGLSNGGVTAMDAGALDPRLKLTIASGSLILHERMWHKELVHCRCQYLDQMEGVLDYYDVFALIAPRALVVQNGFDDPIFPVKSAVAAFEFIKKAYLLENAADRVILDAHDGRHEFRMEIPIGWANRFLPLP
jgi:dienelactone hydrolase